MAPAAEISVVLVCYNRAHLLCRTIDSILSQTFSKFELIICDDCSTDDTETLCRQYALRDRRIRYFRNDVNVGMPRNLNAGILRAQARYIANLHDGDIYDPSLLARWKHALDEYPSVGFVFNAYRALNADFSERRVYREALRPCTRGKDLIERVFFRRWRFDSPIWGTVMARRNVYDQLGLFDEKYGFFSDVDMWLRIAEVYDVAYIESPLIALPSRATAPRLFEDDNSAAMLESIFYSARLRHYAQRPVRGILELVRHYFHQGASRALRLALTAWARLTP